MTASVGRSGWMPDARTGSVRRDAETAGSQGTAMITRAKFQNFKALRDVEITFDSRLTVLVGPNGSGKTSVLQGIMFLTQLAVVEGADPDFGLLKVPDCKTIGADLSEVNLSGTGSRLAASSYTLSIATPRADHVDGLLSLEANQKREEWHVVANWQNGHWSGPIRRPGFHLADAKWFDVSTLIRFSAARLAVPTVIRSLPPLVAKDGTG